MTYKNWKYIEILVAIVGALIFIPAYIYHIDWLQSIGLAVVIFSAVIFRCTTANAKVGDKNIQFKPTPFAIFHLAVVIGVFILSAYEYLI